MLRELRHAEHPDPVTYPDPIQYFLLKIKELTHNENTQPQPPAPDLVSRQPKQTY